MKKNTYEIEKNIEKIKKETSTGFLTPNTIKEIKKRLKKNEYTELHPYPNAEKIILYKNNPPKIKLLKIECPHQLKHSSILGSLFALNITQEVFGDIIFYQENFYIYILDNISTLIETELTKIDKYPIKLKEVNINTLNEFKRNYQEIKIIVSSLRIDTIISKLINTNRNNIEYLIKNNDITLNYDTLKKKQYILKENDIFSIRKYGKYQFKKIIGTTKKENYIVIINKYI